MKTHAEIKAAKGERADEATIEHLSFAGPFYVRDGLRREDLVICCRGCNSSRGERRLLDWFKLDYSVSHNINDGSVAEPVTRYLRNLPPELARFIHCSRWKFAKTYADTWPHEYIVQEEVDNELFPSLARHIDARGYEAHFYKTKNVCFDYGEYTYWRVENIINRCPKSETFEQREKQHRLPY
ncbi:MAG: hypothetical protein WA197_24005 [Candidatus Acidiferrales bacterium]